MPPKPYSWTTVTVTATVVVIVSAIIAIMTGSQEPRTYDWSSKYSGWHSRASAHPSPEKLELASAKTLMVSTYNAMGGDGFNMALFQFGDEEHIAIDSKGKALVMKPEDAIAFKKLLRDALGLSKRDYRIWHLVTCRPFDIVKIAATENKFDEVSIYGYRTKFRDLEDGAGQLPDVLWELFGLIEEAKIWDESDKDSDVLTKVKKYLKSTVG